MKKFALVAASLTLVVSGSAYAQQRVQAQQPARAPGYEAPKINPVITELKALQAKVDALEESAGKQVVVLHFNPGQISAHSENNAAQNQQTAQINCQLALKDRYGRVLAYIIDYSEEKFYISHLVCETKA